MTSHKKYDSAPDTRMVVGYIRVSTREQAETKLSLTNQEEKLKAYAITQDLKLDRIFSDAAESAKDLNRPAVQELLELVKRGKVGHVVIYKLDRLIRNVGDLSDLLRLFQKENVTLSAVTESLNTGTASGKMVVQMIGVIAEWERDTIAERTVAALSVKRGRNEKLGGIRPYGWAVKVKGGIKVLVPDPKEQGTLQGILKSHGEGEGYQAIAEALNASQTPPRKGKRWYASTIRGVCLRGNT